MPAMSGQTLYDKIWDAHVVSTDANGESILYIDLHLIHEVTTPQAFAGQLLRGLRGLGVAEFGQPRVGDAGVAFGGGKAQIELALAVSQQDHRGGGPNGATSR